MTERRTITGRVLGYVWSIHVQQWPESWLFLRWAFRRGTWKLTPIRSAPAQRFRGRREAEAFALAAQVGAP